MEMTVGTANIAGTSMTVDNKRSVEIEIVVVAGLSNATEFGVAARPPRAVLPVVLLLLD